MIRVLASETYLDLVTDWAHWAFELTVEAVTAAVAYGFGKRAVRRHDEKHHPTTKEQS